MKPCPFCGAKIDKDDKIFGVRYNEKLKRWLLDHTCHYEPNKHPAIDVNIAVYGKTKEEVIERWNGRAENKKSKGL